MEQTQSLALVDMFNYQGNKLRHIIIDDNPWFIGADVCNILDIENVSDAINKLDEDEKLISTLPISGQRRSVLCVNEPGLYGLVFQSRKPEAKTFKRWIAHEVLPTIRKTGSYSVNEQAPQSFDFPALMAMTPDELNKAFRIVRRYYRIANTVHTPRLPRPQEPLEEAIMRHVHRLDNPTATDLHNYIKRHSLSEIRETLAELVKTGLLTAEPTSHSTRYSC